MKYELTPCSFPDCKKPEHIRGLCTTHYQTVAQMVSRGKTTWEKLEKSGKVPPAGKKRGRPSVVQNYFLGSNGR